jgi:hypothetical protein
MAGSESLLLLVPRDGKEQTAHHADLCATYAFSWLPGYEVR